MIAAAVLFLLAVPASVRAPAATATPLQQFFQYQRSADYASVRIGVQVPMRDGIHLGCYLYRPAAKGTAVPASGRFPGIVNNFTPYYIAYPVGAFQGAYFAQHGYLDLECTPRGIGLSEGTFPGWFSAVENFDNYDLIEWLVKRADSTGEVAQEGESYGGMTSYRVAALHPPGLVTIAPQQADSSLYLEYSYPGGIRSLGDPYWYLFAAATSLGRSLTSTQELAWLTHPLLDAYWQQIDIAPKLPAINVPILAFGGWRDLFQDGMVRNYMALRPNTYLIDGPWQHGSTFDQTVTTGALLAWFDHWLYHDPRAPMPPTHVASYLMPAGPWQALEDWPPRQAGTQTLTLETSGTLAATPGPPGDRSYLVNTAAGLVDLPQGDHLTFGSPPLPSAETIAGAGEVDLIATLSDPTRLLARSADTNFVFHLYDMSPGGSKTLITRGYLKATHYRSHSSSSIIPLGQPVTYSVPLWQVDYRVAAGDHLELLVESGEQSCCLSAAPALAQPLFPLRVKVATGTGGSTIILPVTTAN